jgi:hypothetical protein
MVWWMSSQKLVIRYNSPKIKKSKKVKKLLLGVFYQNLVLII